MTPRELYRRTCSDAVELRQMRAALPPEVFSLAPWRGWMALGRSYAIIAAGEMVLAFIGLRSGVGLLWRIPVVVAACVVVASGMARLFVLGHECGHRAFSRRPWVNDLVGHLCMSPIVTSFHGWRIGHNHHHAHTQLRGVDTDWPERVLTRNEYARAPRAQRLFVRLVYGSPVGLLVGFVAGLLRRAMMVRLYPQVVVSPKGRRQILASNVCALAVSGVIAASLGLRWGVVVMLKCYLVPLYLGMVFGAFVTFLHHTSADAVAYDRIAWTPIRGQVVSTFDVRFAGWFENMFLNINRHLPHHVAPSIPFYHLPLATTALAMAFPGYHQERPFTVRYLARAWGAPLLEPIDEGVYVASAGPP